MKNITSYEQFGKLNEDRKNLEFGCVMLALNHPSWGKVIEMVDESDIYEKDGEFGKENDPHVTVLYGLHGDIPDSEIEKKIAECTAPTLKLENISIFENEEKEYDVVKFDVDGDGLHEMNKSFRELPHTNDFPDYHPHATIAYVKKGAGKKYIQKLKERIEIKPPHIVYSKPDKTKKKYPF